MNKRIFKILTLIFMAIILTACNISEGDIKDRVGAPVNLKPPIQGKWEVVEKLSIEDEILDGEDMNIGMQGLFRKEALILGKDFTESPSFRIKNVNTNDYFSYKYKINPVELGIKEKDIQVITIMDEDKYFMDLSKINDTTAIIFKDDNFYKMNRISEEISIEEVKKYIEVEKSMVQSVESSIREDYESGILLGIKIPKYDEKLSLPKWEYRTLWLNTSNGTVKNAKVIDDLLLPRKNGFWKIFVDRIVEGNDVTDKIETEGHVMIMNDEEIEPEELERGFKKSNITRGISAKRNDKEGMYRLRNILFLSNDYISIEKIEGRENEKKTLEVLGIDNLDENRSLKLSDIIGKEGKDVFNEGTQTIINLNEDIKINETNIGLLRKDGYWTLKGRVNYVENEKELYKDFNLNAIPPEDMIKYDELIIPWSELDSKIAGLVDVFSSPNGELLIAQTEKELIVLRIENGKIVEDDELFSIELPSNANVVMAEWAVGKYTKVWEEEVLKNEQGQLK